MSCVVWPAALRYSAAVRSCWPKSLSARWGTRCSVGSAPLCRWGWRGAALRCYSVVPGTDKRGFRLLSIFIKLYWEVKKRYNYILDRIKKSRYARWMPGFRWLLGRRKLVGGLPARSSSLGDRDGLVSVPCSCMTSRYRPALAASSYKSREYNLGYSTHVYKVKTSTPVTTPNNA